VTLLVSAARAQDFQTWNEVDLVASWRRVDLTVPLLARVDSNLPNPQLAATGIVADLPLRSHLILTVGYLFADLPQRSEFVHLPLVAVSPIFRLRQITISDRNRFEKLVGFANSPVRYRNRLLVDLPLDTRHRWHFFADDEVIFNLSARAWNQNRFQIGAGPRLNPRLSLDLYYLERSVNGGTETHVVGTNCTITVK
jgi:hypothetical protein